MCAIFGLKKLTGALLQHQQHVERLVHKSKEVVPLRYRRELPDFPVKVKSLLSFTHRSVSNRKRIRCGPAFLRHRPLLQVTLDRRMQTALFS